MSTEQLGIVHGSILTTKPLCGDRDGARARFVTTDPAKVTCGACVAAWWRKKGKDARSIIGGRLHVLTMDETTGATILSPLGPEAVLENSPAASTLTEKETRR